MLTILACVGMGFALQAIQQDGLLRGRQNVVKRLAAASSIKFPEMSMDELESTLHLESAAHGVMLVDCRYQDDFSRGTIGQAVNYPLNMGLSAENQMIDRLKQCKKVVLFCQSASCPYSEMIARRLHYSGAKNLYVLTGGFHEWGKRK